MKIANIETFVEHIKTLKPSTAKGTYIQKLALSTTMGPGIKVDSGYVKDLLAQAS